MKELNKEKSIYFRLGAFNYLSFYDIAQWVQDGTDFEDKDYFKWHDSGMTTMPDGYKILDGYLDKTKFENLQSKFEYIKGRLSSYSVTSGKNFIHISYANSYSTRDMLAEWIKEIIDYKFCRINIYKIKKEDWFICCPGVAEVELEADEEIIKYFLYEENIGKPISNEECDKKLRKAVKILSEK